jgi:predicted PurR-regulated permease PerM
MEGGPPAPGVAALRRYALAFGFGFIALGVFVLLVAIYLQLAYQILWASTLAVLFYPLHRQILRLVRNRRTLAATVSTILSIAILFLPAVLVVFNLVGEVRNLWPSMQSVLGPDSYQRISTWLEGSSLRGIAHFVLGIEGDVGPEAVEQALEKGALDLQTYLLEQLRTVTRSVPAVIVQLGITLLAFYFFLRHGPGWIAAMEKALPLEPEHSRRLFRITGQTVNAVFRGVILTAAVQGVLAGLGFWIAGAGLPILLAIATFVGSLVPFVGAVVVWLPVAVVLFLTGHQGAAIGLAIWGALVVSLVDNVMKPILIGREMKLPVLWLFLAIVGGLKLFGFLGVVLGPAVLALAFACFRIYTEGRRSPA